MLFNCRKLNKKISKKVPSFQAFGLTAKESHDLALLIPNMAQGDTIILSEAVYLFFFLYWSACKSTLVFQQIINSKMEIPKAFLL